MSTRFQNQQWMDQKQQFSDKDMLSDVLASIKNVSTMYHQGILEANTHDTRQAFYDLHDHTLEQHLDIIETMKNKGWYNPEKAQTNQTPSRQQVYY